MKRIGITGGIGSGKSAVTDFLREKGYMVIDADEAAREAAMPGEPAMLRLRAEIGDGIFLADGGLDRPALARLIFGDAGMLKTVNGIFHGDIRERMEAAAHACAARGEALIFLAVPLLFESGADWDLDAVWLVTADEDVRIRRVIERDGLSEADVRARMRNQMPEEEKRARADIVIENNETIDALRAQIALALLY